MLNKKRVLLAAVVVGGTVLASTSAQGFLGSIQPVELGRPRLGRPRLGWLGSRW